MKQIDVKTLHKELGELIKQGKGDFLCIASDDNEGNGYHGMFYAATPCDKDYEGLIYDSIETDVNKLVVIG